MAHIDDFNEKSLKEYFNNPSKFKLWLIHKDLIDVCKDCEFRHMCVDSRLPIQRINGSWYHKTECNYNPYIGKWKGTNKYKTLEECGIIVNDSFYIRDDNKIKIFNETL